MEQSFDIHTRLKQQLCGVHIELTGENVTECLGGSRGPSEADLARAYESEVDPRLNYEQAMELAFLIARKMKNGAHYKTRPQAGVGRLKLPHHANGRAAASRRRSTASLPAVWEWLAAPSRASF